MPRFATSPPFPAVASFAPWLRRRFPSGQDLRHPVETQPEGVGHAAAEQGPQIHSESVRYVRSRRSDEFIRHNLCFRRDLFKGRELIVNRIKARAVDRHRAVPAAPERVLDCLFAYFTRLPLVHIRDAADETALHIAEGVGPDALVAQLVLDQL